MATAGWRYCALCGAPAEATDPETLRAWGWTVQASASGDALLLECRHCQGRRAAEARPSSGLLRVLRGRRRERPRRLQLPYVVRGESGLHVLYAKGDREALEVARSRGWLREDEQVRVEPFR